MAFLRVAVILAAARSVAASTAGTCATDLTNLAAHQTEQLRLSIYDEHDYRDKVTAPPPSLSAMHELKRQLQHCLELHDHTAGAPVRAATPRRGALSRYTPLPDVL